jgi:hypothetical protein
MALLFVAQATFGGFVFVVCCALTDRAHLAHSLTLFPTTTNTTKSIFIFIYTNP